MMLFSLYSALSIFACIFVWTTIIEANSERSDYRWQNKELLQRLLANYDRLAIPVPVNGHPLSVSLSLSLKNIVSVKTARNEVCLFSWISLSWRDEDLDWERRVFNISSVRIPSSSVWTPDFEMVEDIGTTLETKSPDVLKVSSHGQINWTTKKHFCFYCDMAGLNSGNDVSCSLTFRSWTYDNSLLAFADVHPNAVDLSDYFTASKFEIRNAEIIKIGATGGSESYDYIRITVTIRKP